MAKQGMKRPEVTHEHHHNMAADVGMIQGKAKHGHVRANPIIAGTAPPSQKVWHTQPYARDSGYAAVSVYDELDKPISQAYAEIDNDLARDNLENDIPDADLQDL